MGDRDALSLLLACLAGKRPAGERDWESIIAIANESLTTPTLAERVLAAEHAISLPADVRLFLETVRNRSRWRGEVMDRQLEEALVQLNAAGIVPVLIKGSALRAQMDKRDEGRLLSDLDLVLALQQKQAAVAALQSVGYTCRDALDDGSNPVVLARTSDAGMIDLQFGFGAAGIDYDYAELAASSTQATFGAGRALLPDATTQAAIFIIHDQIKDQDYWRGLIELRHLFDIAVLADAVDWERLARKFSTPLAQTALRIQLIALQRLLGLPIPRHLTKGVWPALQHRRRMMQLRHPALSRLFSTLTLVADVLTGRIGARIAAKPRWHVGTVPQTGGSAHLFRPHSVGKL